MQIKAQHGQRGDPPMKRNLGESDELGRDRCSVDQRLRSGARYGTGQSAEPQELRPIEAYWHASLFLSAGMIYLRGNPLLREPLKPKTRSTALLRRSMRSIGCRRCACAARMPASSC
ncbi:MAG: hypothetical protein WB764_14720 [Xanthobacteraceae bacterium]